MELPPVQWSKTRIKKPEKITAWEMAKEITSVERSDYTTLSETAVIAVMAVLSVVLEFFLSSWIPPSLKRLTQLDRIH